MPTLIARSTFEGLGAAGHATPAFLDFILAFGLARREAVVGAELVASSAAPASAVRPVGRGGAGWVSSGLDRVGSGWLSAATSEPLDERVT